MLGLITKLGPALRGASKFAGSNGVREFLKPSGIVNSAGKFDLGTTASRLAPDVLFGGLAGAMTPGDLTDKLIVGTGSALGGGLGGIATTGAAGKLLGIKGNAGMMADFVGGFGGDMVGQMASDQVLKGKDLVTGGKGQTPWEKLSEEQEDQLINQVLAQHGIIPGQRSEYLSIDPTGLGSGII